MAGTAPTLRRRGVDRLDEPGTVAVSPSAVAPVSRRLLALAVDQVALVLLAVLGALVATAARPGAAAVGAIVAGGVGVVALVGAEAVTGASLGGLAVGLRTVRASTGRPAGVLRVAVRSSVVGIGTLALVGGAYLVAGSGAWDPAPTQRGWHDRLAGTLVLQAWAVPPRRRRGWAEAPRAVAPRPGPSDEPGGDGVHPVDPTNPADPADPGEPTGPVDPSGSVRPVERAGDEPTPFARLDEVELTRLTFRDEAVRPARLVLWFDTGEEVEVRGVGIVGRAPDAEAGREVLHVVAIDDPDRSVSRVHLRFGPDSEGGLWVVDTGSTNGTVVLDPAGAASLLPAGRRAVVGPGWTVRFGSRTMRVRVARSDVR